MLAGGSQGQRGVAVQESAPTRTGKRPDTYAEAFSLPFVIFAQLGLVLLHLRFQFAEGFLATGSDVDSGACGMQRARWQR